MIVCEACGMVCGSAQALWEHVVLWTSAVRGDSEDNLMSVLVHRKAMEAGK